MSKKISRKLSNTKKYNIKIHSKKNNIKKRKSTKKQIPKNIMKGGLSGITYFQLGEEEYNMSCYNSTIVEKHGNNFDLALVYYEIAFKLGYMPACAKLSWLTIFGKPLIKSDYSKCFTLLNDKVHPDCQGVLSVCYLYGYGCEKNEQLAYTLAIDSAKEHSKYGHYALGEIYYYGLPEICQQNYINSFQHYKISAESGVEAAQRKIGDLYKSGLGIELDNTLAIQWYKLAAYQADIEACFKLISENIDFNVEKWYNIAFYHIEYENREKLISYIQYLENTLHKNTLEIYNQLIFLGQFLEAFNYGILNIDSNVELKYSVLWSILVSSKNKSIDNSYVYEKIKDDPSPNAKGILSYYYYINKDYETTYHLSKQSSDSGNKYGQYTLAILYLNNLGGVSYDDKEYFRLLSLSSEQGLINAKNNLAICFKNGNGTTQNFIEAIKLFRNVALYENITALYQLGEMIENGKGTTPNKIEAIRWYKRLELQIPKINKSNLLIKNIIDNETLYSMSEKDINDVYQSVNNILRSFDIMVDDINRLISSLQHKRFTFQWIESGIIKWMNPDNNLNYYIGECYDYKPHGIGKLQYPNGDIYVGSFFYGIRYGLGNMRYTDNSKYIGEWDNNNKHGLGMFIYVNNNNVYKGQWINNLQHGLGVYNYFDNSALVSTKGKWIHGMRNGPFIFQSYDSSNAKLNKYVFYINDDIRIDRIESFLPSHLHIENPYSSIVKNRYITIIILLHGSDLINSNCKLRNYDDHHIRIISPVSCGSANMTTIISTKNIFNKLFYICNLDSNKDASSFQKMKKFIDISNIDKNGIIYDLIENTTTLRKPLIEHEYTFDANPDMNNIYLVDTNHISEIVNQEIIDIFRQSYTNINNVDQLNRFDILPNIKRLLNIEGNEKFMRSTLINKLLGLGYQTINIIDLTCRNINEQKIQENLTIDKPYYCDYTIANLMVDDTVMSNPFQ